MDAQVERLANMPIISHKRPHKSSSVVSGAVPRAGAEEAAEKATGRSGLPH